MYSREELDFIWENIDHLDDRTFGDAGKGITIMRLYSMGDTLSCLNVRL